MGEEGEEKPGRKYWSHTGWLTHLPKTSRGLVSVSEVTKETAKKIIAFLFLFFFFLPSEFSMSADWPISRLITAAELIFTNEISPRCSRFVPSLCLNGTRIENEHSRKRWNIRLRSLARIATFFSLFLRKEYKVFKCYTGFFIYLSCCPESYGETGQVFDNFYYACKKNRFIQIFRSALLLHFFIKWSNKKSIIYVLFSILFVYC